MTLTPFVVAMAETTASPEVRYTLVEGTEDDGNSKDGAAKNNGKAVEMLQLVDGMDATKTSNRKLYLYIAASAGQYFV